MADQTITKYIVRHVEAFLGYTATSGEFIRSCEQIPSQRVVAKRGKGEEKP
jgi:hypothetical protein